jgi:uncharacterized protein (TIGR03118 family)
MRTIRSAITVIASGALAAGCQSDAQSASIADLSTHARVHQIDLISDQQGVARHVDPELVNPWGVALDDEGLLWIANNGTGKIGIVDRDGNPSSGEYKDNQFDLGAGIDGIVRNTSSTLEIHENNDCAIADFLVASETGQLFGINGDLDANAGVVFADRSAVDAIYKGVAIVDTDHETHVLAADFHNARIDVFDDKGTLLDGSAFVDPDLPAGYAPFNVVAIGDRVFIPWAMQDADAEDEVAGPGLGAISVFDTAGKLLARVATGGELDAPWAITNVGHELVVGNFGDGHLSLFDTRTYHPEGQLTGKNGPIAIDGLWGLAPGRGQRLYFAAGPDDEAHGLFGSIAD